MGRKIKFVDQEINRNLDDNEQEIKHLIAHDTHTASEMDSMILRRYAE